VSTGTPTKQEEFTARAYSIPSALREVTERIIASVVLTDIVAMAPRFSRDHDGYVICTMIVRLRR
jgi:hypothetical protein